MGITSEEQNKVKRMKRTEDSLSNLWDNFKLTNIWIIGVAEEEEKKERVWEIFWRDYSWKFPQHEKGNSQVQEAQRVPYRINPRRNTPRHILVKLTKTKYKERILKVVKKQQVTYKGNPIHLTADLSAETLQPKLQYLARISFKTDGEIESFSASKS